MKRERKLEAVRMRGQTKTIITEMAVGKRDTSEREREEGCSAQSVLLSLRLASIVASKWGARLYFRYATRLPVSSALHTRERAVCEPASTQPKEPDARRSVATSRQCRH